MIIVEDFIKSDAKYCINNENYENVIVNIYLHTNLFNKSIPFFYKNIFFRQFRF